MADNKAVFAVDVETEEGRRNLRALVAALKTMDAELDDTVGKAHTSSTAFGTFMGNMAAKAVDMAMRAGQAFLRMARDFVTSSVQIAVERDALQQGIESMLGSAEAGAIALERLKAAALKPGVTFDVAVSGFMKLIGSGMEANAAVETIEAFGRAAAASGGGAEELARGLKAMSDMFGQGRITAQDLRLQLLQALPAIGAAFQREFGTTSAEAIMTMVTSVEDFRARTVTSINEVIPEVNSLKNEITNLKDVWLSAKASFGRGLIGDDSKDQVVGLAEVIRDLTPELENLGEHFRTVGEDALWGLKGIKDLIEGLGLYAGLTAAMRAEQGLTRPGPFGIPIPSPSGIFKAGVAYKPGGKDEAGGLKPVQAPGATLTDDPDSTVNRIPDERDLQQGPSAEQLAAAVKEAAAAAVIVINYETQLYRAQQAEARAKGDFETADRFGRLIAEQIVRLAEATLTPLDDPAAPHAANAALLEIENEITRRAERAAREAEREAAEKKRERLGGARDAVEQAGLLREMALLGEDESQVEARTSTLTAAMAAYVDVLSEAGENTRALRVELDMLRLAQEEEEKLTLGQEILAAGAPSGIDRLLRSKGAGVSSYTSPIEMFGGAIGGDFGGAVQGEQSARLRDAIVKFFADLLVHSLGEGRLYP